MTPLMSEASRYVCLSESDNRFLGAKVDCSVVGKFKEGSDKTIPLTVKIQTITIANILIA